jgi:hypothetical protein
MHSKVRLKFTMPLTAKHTLIIAALSLTNICYAEDRELRDISEFVQVVSKPAFETKPQKARPGFQRLLDRITIEPSDSSPSSFIVSGRVVSDNNGGPLERIAIFVGSEGDNPQLAGLTNADGEFKFRLWVKEDQRDSEIQVPKDFSGYLYVSESAPITIVRQPILTAPVLIGADYRRYSLMRLRELSKTPKQ